MKPGQAALQSIIRSGVVQVPGISCWMWIRSYGSHGYPQVRVGHTVMTVARAVFLACHDEPLGPHEEARHTCDWPPCCNPDHLIRGTKLDNMRDMTTRGRQVHKLEPRHAIEIRESFERGESTASLSARFGIARQNVWAIINRKAWGHV